MTTEQIVIHLPLPVEVVGVIGEAIGTRWPGARILTEHDHGPDKLVVEIDLDVEPAVDDYEIDLRDGLTD